MGVLRKRSEPVVRIGSPEDQAEADLWRSLLEAEGIPCLVKNRNPLSYQQAVIPFMPFAFDAYVPRAAAKRARAILAPSLKPRRARPFSPGVRRLATVWFLLGPRGQS